MHEQRLDKWLWCARLVKTRALAVEAIKAGRVDVNGQPAKPSRLVRPGDRLLVRHPPFVLDLEVLGLAPQRVGASLAGTLYAESPASLATRQKQAEELRMTAVIEAPRRGKLSKKDRRDRVSLKRGQDFPAD